jgi:hypothetical protein
MLGFPLGILSAAGAGGGVAGDYELISSEILGTTAASVTFSSLGDYSSTYKHLQLRMTAKTSGTGYQDDPFVLQFNGDSGANYNWHLLLGDGSSVASAASPGSAYTFGPTSSDAGASIFGALIADILDPYSTSKNTTTRFLSGYQPGSGAKINLSSMLWRNTASITSISLKPIIGANWVAGSRFSLYGIRG